MAKIFQFFKKVVCKGRGNDLSAADADDLRNAFKARYHSFKLLLSANNKALEIMTELEHALKGSRPFGMSFVRTNCTAVTVNVYTIVKNLDQLAPGKYKDLFDRFKGIQDQINRILSMKRQTAGDCLVMPFAVLDKSMADQAGSKMANLGEAMKIDRLRVPSGFVITSLAYERFMEHNDLQAEIDRRLQASTVEQLDQLYALSADIQQLIIRAAVPGDLENAIMEAYGELEKAEGKDIKVSMRSSALGEDAAGTSFAGQYRSELNVSADHLIEAYKEIVASKYNLQAISYRLNRGILDEDVAMCVGCMVMVHAAAGGVTYSRNPVNFRDDSIFINSVWGLPKSVVDGSVGCDMFVVSRRRPFTIVEKVIREKEHKFVCYPDEGVCRMDLTGEKSREPSLTDAQVFELTQMALAVEEYYDCPQDIEWAIDHDGRAYLLQCRPLKQMESAETVYRSPERQSVHGEAGIEGGITASAGVASGPVFVIRKNGDTLLFPEGAVLVAAQALPRWAALLSRAVAVVTEQGSAAGHLANVAREFGVPAIFGVPSVTELLQNNDVVTVDADGPRIYKGRIESLLEERKPRKNLMEGSPVYDLLEEVSKLIVPLNLLDPESSDFKPRNCRTLHDITRFCHEKSVKEMFNFGKEHHFSERASKQLVCDVPMLWWIINLDDGFKEDVPGQYVHLDNIVCIPMLSLWDGIIAVPWEGPPAVNARGFMSVLMEATANPALDPSMPSPYANRNYFMISKNFCSLSSRFGFHFCTIEALVGDRAGENYISFSLKGGAADTSRRVRRVRFVGSMMEEFGFRSEVKGDSVISRLEGYDQEYMKERLKMLGYVLMHTRQLDMVMSADGTANSYREKFLKDIYSFTNLGPPAPETEDRDLVPQTVG